LTRTIALRTTGILASSIIAIGAAHALTPPRSVNAADTPSDSGRSITISWELSPDDPASEGAGPAGQGEGRESGAPPAQEGNRAAETGPEGAAASRFVGYEILKAGPPAGLDAAAAAAWTGPPEPASFKVLGSASAGQASYRDPAVHDGIRHFYKVVAVSESGERAESSVAGPAVSSAQWIDFGKKYVFAIALLIGGAVVYFIETARRGKKMFVRKIAGLEAIGEAVGRATEMGRSIVFVPGTQDMNDIQTVAGVTILGYVAKTVAEYDTRLMVPTSKSLVMTTGRETVRQAYIAGGRPDSYREDDIYYTTDEQFGYVAAVNGLLVRTEPATCFYMGAFFAESLILAETGNSVGAIQIAGTAQPAQLPFFVAACDYTLIGEEMFAASAYLSGEPRQLGSLKGQDLGKVVAIAFILGGGALATAASLTGSPWLSRVTDLVMHLFTVS
jgi:hypothetical protein